MKQVRLTLDAGGQEAEIHPMYDLLVNAEYIERATAMHWNYSGEELGIMHYIEGDPTAFRDDIKDVLEVIDYELTVAETNTFYVYIRDATNQRLRELFDLLNQSPVVVIPPVEYTPDGSVSYSVFGPSSAIQSALDGIPDPITISVTKIGSLAAVPSVLETILSARQQQAIQAAFDLGYYEIPRTATHKDVASATGCAPSTSRKRNQSCCDRC